MLNPEITIKHSQKREKQKNTKNQKNAQWGAVFTLSLPGVGSASRQLCGAQRQAESSPERANL